MQARKILILNWRCPYNPLAGGAEMITLQHAKAWVAAGYEVTWFAERYNDAPHSEVIDGVHIERISFGNKMHSLRAPFVYLAYLFTSIFRYWIEYKGSFDLVIDEIHGPSMWVTFWAWKSKKLVYVHEVAQDIWDKMLPFPLSLIGKIAERIMYIFYRKLPILTASVSTLEDLLQFGIPESNIKLIPHGLSIEPLSNPKKKEKDITLLFIARLVKMKGVEEAVDVMTHVVDVHPDAKMWIVGKGPDEYLKHVQSVVKKKKIDENITFQGHVSEAKKIELFQKAHFLIHTSIREGFGLVVIEANSQGTPAMVYDSPGLRDIVKNNVNGYVVPYGKSKELARKIMDVYKDKSRYRTLQESSLSYVDDYKWDVITKQSLDYLEEILE